MSEPRILAFVLAGGEGRRLRPLIEDRAKPAPLIEHVARVWRPALVKRGCTLRPRVPDDAYKGTAHAVYRNLHVLSQHEPDLVAVFAADHVYRMDVRQMARFHLGVGADASVAARPVPLRHDPLHAFASMGNYLFEPIALVDLLEESVGRGGSDFGRDVLPHAVESGARVFAYDFSTNRVPGVRWYEDPAYWRDVGTVQALSAARRDVEGRNPRFDLSNADWPLQPAIGEPSHGSQVASAG